MELNCVFEKNENLKELSYFLGYFWADGTINCNKYLVMEILKTDVEELIPIVSKITDFKYSERHRPNRQPQGTIFINNKNFAQLLIQMGKYSHSIESHEKILKWIPSKYHLYFLRGLIDGDGCFYSNNLDCTHFTISSSYNQDWSYLIEIFKDYGLNVRLIRRVHKKSSSSIIRSASFYEIKKFTENLYENKDNIWLSRKYNKMKSIISSYEENHKKYEVMIDDIKYDVDNLSKFCRDHKLCYNLVNKLANNKIKKYKNVKIIKWKQKSILTGIV